MRFFRGMDTKYKHLVKNTLVLGIGNFSSKILVFLLVPLYTSVLSTTEYGIYDLTVSTASLLYPVLTISIVDAVMRFTMDDAYDKKAVARVGIVFVSISFILAFLIILLLSKLPFATSVHGLEVYCLLYYISYTLNQYFIQLAKGMDRAFDMALAGIISTVIMLSGNICFLLIFKMGLKGFYIANISSLLVPSCFLFFKLKFIEYSRGALWDRRLIRTMITYSAPLIFSTIGWWVNNASDRYVVTLMCGLAANGVLSVSYKIPSIINTVFSMFGQAWQISAIKEYDKKNTNSFYADSFSFINLGICIGCSLLIVLSRPLGRVLYSNNFYEAWKYAPFLLVSSVFNCASGFIGPILSAAKNSKAMATSAIIGAVTNIILNFLLVYMIGVQGAAIATAISAFIIYLVRYKSTSGDFYIKDYYKVIISWIIITIEAFCEIREDYYAFEIILILVFFGINYKNISKILRMMKVILTTKRKRNG